ncbi:unnamed protein product [Rangifer tarandus platyrhynchus]|uniref:Uncharacterized protein n=2 Tax=Rangifer tarandus platyrhynchus TaxID=3082113 RepID=A0ACB0F6K3_RANTA|nr:unnamed protein product [Rangifer tarandus platyrhynchus]CAI9708279.1 unnamed protein product [Rangifer tarandus platyrhynchus]
MHEAGRITVLNRSLPPSKEIESPHVSTSPAEAPFLSWDCGTQDSARPGMRDLEQRPAGFCLQLTRSGHAYHVSRREVLFMSLTVSSRSRCDFCRALKLIWIVKKYKARKSIPSPDILRGEGRISSEKLVSPALSHFTGLGGRAGGIPRETDPGSCSPSPLAVCGLASLREKWK